MGHASKKSSASPALVRLSAVDLKHLLKPKAGFEAYAETLVAMVQAQPDVLRVVGFDAASTLDELRAYEALQPVVASAEQQLAMARETRLLHASNVWRAMLKIYQRAQIEAIDDAKVASALAAFGAFMKRGHRKAKKKVATPTPVAA